MVKYDIKKVIDAFYREKGIFSKFNINNHQIIISVSHGFCNPLLSYRHCDINSLPFALILYDKLLSENIKTEMVVSQLYREKIDKNRIGSEDTQFRRDLDRLFSYSNENTIFLDIHSAPKSTLKRSFDLYLLELASTDKDLRFNQNIYNFFKNKGKKIYLLQGSDDNAIIYRAINTFNLKNVSLIEISEGLNLKELDELSELFIEFIKIFNRKKR